MHSSIDSASAASASAPSPLSASDYMRMILTAPVYDVCIETALQKANRLSRRYNSNIYLKREDTQPVFSFKLRGAYNKMSSLTRAQKAKGVVTCSAGNHAQGVALAAQYMNVHATIVMPTFAASIKVDAVRAYGAEVILHGADFDEAAAECRRLALQSGKVILPPFDDPHVIAGQGTIAMEMCRQWSFTKHGASTPDVIFVCVGGGGLIAGISVYCKQLWPNVKIIGVEAYDANSMQLALLKGERVEMQSVGLFADGAAVRLAGEETFRLCRMYVDEVITVDNDEICASDKGYIRGHALCARTRRCIESGGM